MESLRHYPHLDLYILLGIFYSKPIEARSNQFIPKWYIFFLIYPASCNMYVDVSWFADRNPSLD